MPYDWENDQFNQIQEMIEESPSEPQMDSIEQIDEVMDEAERRFEVAQYYKLLLQDSMFQNKTEASQRVEDEIRAFIKERLGVLLGVKTAPAVSSGFTPEQISVLSAFADLGEEAPEMLRLLMGKIAKKMGSKPPKPAPEPALKVVKEPTRPMLKKTEQPKLKASAPAPKGKKPVDSAKNYKRMDSRVPEQYKDDPTLKIEGNKIYVQARTPSGEPLWEKVDNETRPLYKDITPPAKPVGVKPVPMPDGAHLEMITAQQAQKTLQESAGQGNNMILNQLKGQE